MLVNRPISQYELNFNSHIEETVVKSLKKSSIAYNLLIFIESSIKNENYIEKFYQRLFRWNWLRLSLDEKRKNLKIKIGGSKNFVELSNNNYFSKQMFLIKKF